MKDHFSYIEAYIQDKLNPEQKKDFEEAMEMDPDLKEAVENYWKIEPVLDLLIEDDLQKKMKEIADRPAKRVPMRKWWQVAATLLILIAALFWFVKPAQPTLPQLALEFYQAPPSTESRGDENTQPLKPEDYTFLRANDLIRAEKPQEAEEVLQALINLNTSYNEQAEWLLVITAMLKDDRDLTVNRLSKILGQPNHPYYRRGLELREAADLD